MIERGAAVVPIADVLAQRVTAGRPAHEFLRRDSMSLLVYHLAAGEPDQQQPHTEDEVYYVLDGTGVFDADGQSTPVKPGDVIFAARDVVHRFRDYPDGITLLVVFAPARGTNAR
jgi:quercetin dioxygenase-like cupin family protein